MADIATLWNADLAVGDWSISASSWPIWVDENGNSIRDEIGRPVGNAFRPGEGLISGSDLYTAALISLFTDAAASDDDVIPDGSKDPRGWWGDTAIGSKLWLLSRVKATADIPARAKAYIQQATQWFLDDDVASSINVATEWTRPNMLGCQVTFYRADGARLALAFSRLWDSA